ncbi:response regulator transcription factor [Cytophagaceae bacterium YF14B1]|uniref:Response regulator transcription factor n=1 Tax=Xanthocytophaga flava TaxID=3048013 RepID=A0AAE3QU65_9BACT|nr:response regulator transcription factor [Xanthocytophaga flavus]MDJ1485535.1 response regulator transcription factor [Xanthocytophaga flavus]
MKILLIEDEQNLADFMAKGLLQAGHIVEVSHNGAKGLEIAGSDTFDLILLDLMLPGTNGYDILTNLRSFNIFTPVLIISALSDSSHVVKGLDMGAVDYIKKPFDWEELLARIRVIQKKLINIQTPKIIIDDMTIDLGSRKVTRAEKEIRLTAKEFVLLEYLARNANRIVSKNQIMENVWEMDFDPGSNIVEVHIHGLRKKIDKGSDNPLIETVLGLGYSLKGEKS